MLKKLLLCIALAASASAQAQSVSARTLGGPVAKSVAYFSQEAPLVGGTVIQVSVAPLTTSVDGFGTTKLVTKLAGSPVGLLPTMVLPNPVTQAVAQSTALAWAASEMPAFETRVATWLTSQGLSVAIYNYSQEIMISTTAGPKKKAIAFNATIDNRGRPTYGAPKIVDADPTMVEAIYTPLAPAQGLPTSWTYPDAGKIKWRLLNKRYEVISNWVTVDVGGSFDLPPTAADPDAGLRCLVDARNPPACGTAQPTMRTIIDGAGASWGLLSYIRQLEPLYEINPTTGEPVAVSAITVDERLWDCANYVNNGHYGFVLALTADQYLVMPNTSTTDYSRVQTYGGKGLSPTVAYSKTVAVSALNGAHPDSVIISPEPGSSEIWSRGDADKMKSVLYVSPVVSEMAGQGVDFYGGPAVFTGMVGQNHQYTIGSVGDNYWGDGQYDQAVYFDLPGPGALEKLTLKAAHYDDLILVAINGTILFVGPYGGNMLEYSQGVAEAFCSQKVGYWECYDYSQIGPYAGPATLITIDLGWEGGGVVTQLACPAGYTLEGTNCHFPVVKATYAFCQLVTSGGFEGESSSSPATSTLYCGNSTCPMGTAQYYKGAVGANGCASTELSQNFHHTINANMLPYLKAGQNSIFIRTIVGDRGEGYVDIEGRRCGTEAGLPTSAPAGPGAPAVTGALLPLAQ